MSNQSLSRVLRFREPTVYFRELSRRFTNGYRQQTLPPSRYQGPVVPMTRPIEGYMSTSDYYRTQGRNQRPGQCDAASITGTLVPYGSGLECVVFGGGSGRRSLYGG